MKQYTTKQVARVSKRHETAIARLVKEGKLKGERGERNRWVIEGESLPVLAETVKKLLPKGGWRKRVAPKVKVSEKTPANLSQVLRFMELSEATREMLLDIGEKASEDTITLLVGLV